MVGTLRFAHPSKRRFFSVIAREAKQSIVPRMR